METIIPNPSPSPCGQDQAGGLSEVMEVVTLAGHILLENGAEISRVEDIMNRMASHYGVDSKGFFVVSNGIFTTGSSHHKISKRGSQTSCYANVDFIPIHASEMEKVVMVNRLSYDISRDSLSLDEVRRRLSEIRSLPVRPFLERMLGPALGAAGFCAVFGGSWLDCGADFVVGALTMLFATFFSSRFLSKVVGGMLNATLAGILCVLCWRLGFGHSLPNLVIGAIMPLVPGVSFVNGVRDLANGDHLAGLTRMTDAIIGFVAIGIGISVALLLDGVGTPGGGFVQLGGMRVSDSTSAMWIQALAAFTGTVGFAILYSAPRDLYAPAGAVGAVGWVAYLAMVRYAGSTATVACLVAALIICILSRILAVPYKIPANILVICGIFCLVPGAGIFWATYHLIAGGFGEASLAGFAALKAALAIVMGIVLAMELPQKWFSGPWMRHHRAKSS